jgi:hypothetical protein
MCSGRNARIGGIGNFIVDNQSQGCPQRKPLLKYLTVQRSIFDAASSSAESILKFGALAP